MRDARGVDGVLLCEHVNYLVSTVECVSWRVSGRACARRVRQRES